MLVLSLSDSVNLVFLLQQGIKNQRCVIASGGKSCAAAEGGVVEHTRGVTIGSHSSTSLCTGKRFQSVM